MCRGSDGAEWRSIHCEWQSDGVRPAFLSRKPTPSPPRCRRATQGAELATKADLAEVKADVAALRSELRQSKLRLEAKIEAVRSDIGAVKADILNRIFDMILGTLVVNIIAVVGAMFAVAKPAGH